MDVYLYKLIEEEIKTQFFHYTGYGIACIQTASGVVLEQIKDIFTHKDKAELFVLSLNTNQLDPVHLRDVVDDCLG